MVKLGTRAWIGGLLVVLVAVDAAVFLAYQQSNPNIGLGAQLIGYLESSAFSVITVSIVIPIILAFLNQFFNIGSAVQQGIESSRQEFRNRLQDTIKGTTGIWNDSSALCERIVYWRKYGETDELLALERDEVALTNKANEVVNAWSRMFKNLQSEDMDLFRVFLNMLLESTDAVIEQIKACDGSDAAIQATRELQESLGLVVSGVRSVLHQNMMTILNLSASLLTEDYSAAELAETKSEIKDALDGLRRWALGVRRNEAGQNELLPLASGPEVEQYRKIANDFVDWKKTHLKSINSDFPKWGEFSRAYSAIPEDQFNLGLRTEYSVDYVKRLARDIVFNAIQTDLNERAQFLSKPTQ